MVFLLYSFIWLITLIVFQMLKQLCCINWVNTTCPTPWDPTSPNLSSAQSSFSGWALGQAADGGRPFAKQTQAWYCWQLGMVCSVASPCASRPRTGSYQPQIALWLLSGSPWLVTGSSQSWPIPEYLPWVPSTSTPGDQLQTTTENHLISPKSGTPKDWFWQASKPHCRAELHCGQPPCSSSNVVFMTIFIDSQPEGHPTNWHANSN